MSVAPVAIPAAMAAASAATAATATSTVVAASAAVSAAAGVAGTVMSAMKSGQSAGAAAVQSDLSMIERQYAQRSRAMGNQVQAEGIRTQAAETDVTGAGMRLQTAQQEFMRRRTLAKLTAANTIDRIGRGAAYDPTDSASAIEAENMRLGEEDIGNLRLMSEINQTRISFEKSKLLLSAKATEAGFGELPIRRDPYLDLASDQRSGIWTEAALKIGRDLAGYAPAAYNYFGGSSYSGGSPAATLAYGSERPVIPSDVISSGGLIGGGV